MKDIIFKNKKPNPDKLLAYGFSENYRGYGYSAEIIGGQMRFDIMISVNGDIGKRVIDVASNEEYVLHLMPGAVGAFVGAVRAECEKILSGIAGDCFDTNIFESEYAKAVINYALKSYGGELEFLWERFPDNAILRRKDTNKWYAALLTVSKIKIGIASDGMLEILDLRGKPEEITKIVDGKKYFPGYHMNKKNWFTVCLDGSVQLEEIYRRINDSYELATK